jgi:hypothetical protein
MTTTSQHKTTQQDNDNDNENDNDNDNDNAPFDTKVAKWQ